MARPFPPRSLGSVLLACALGLPAQAWASDRSTRFPMRREGGGTRSGCASRVLAPLVPAQDPLTLDAEPRLAVIEGPTPRPAPLVLRLGTTRLELAARREPSLRLVSLPPAPVAALAGGTWNGLWESYPACEGAEEPVAPAALGWLRPPSSTEDSVIQALWQRCGGTVATAALLSRFGYGHLQGLLPPQLAVICESAPQQLPSP
jgi:hypothetical protein